MDANRALHSSFFYDFFSVFLYKIGSHNLYKSFTLEYP